MAWELRFLDDGHLFGLEVLDEVDLLLYQDIVQLPVGSGFQVQKGILDLVALELDGLLLIGIHRGLEVFLLGLEDPELTLPALDGLLEGTVELALQGLNVGFRLNDLRVAGTVKLAQSGQFELRGDELTVEGMEKFLVKECGDIPGFGFEDLFDLPDLGLQFQPLNPDSVVVGADL